MFAFVFPEEMCNRKIGLLDPADSVLHFDFLVSVSERSVDPGRFLSSSSDFIGLSGPTTFSFYASVLFCASGVLAWRTLGMRVTAMHISGTSQVPK